MGQDSLTARQVVLTLKRASTNAKVGKMSDVEGIAPRFNPFRTANLDLAKPADSPLLKRELLQRVDEMSLGEDALKRANDTVRTLTVKDLNDLAAEFAGVDTRNKTVSDLSFEDLRNLEEVFMDFKLEVAERAALDPGFTLAAVDVSCCCCTPCCSCASSQTEPLTV